ncbi:hypothetical protein MASR2M47_47420 [Draconibacterium sp.]|jgi:hypothetical protein
MIYLTNQNNMNTNFLKFLRLPVLAIICVLSSQSVVSQTNQFTHDYSQTLVMKMLIAVPDDNGGTKVYCDLDKALNLIKQTDNLTLGAPKIIYLVGWQYRGHDDLYPAFFEVNPALKRPGDASARESLLWLMEEAKKYNTIVSLHINMTDAYDDSPLWKEYVDNDMISKNEDGSLRVIGNYNNKKAYQINYHNEWEKGYAQMRVDKLLELLPALKEAGTIHIDAWIARESKGHNETIETEKEFQKKVCAYWRSKGIDITSEWVMDYMLGLVPQYWHFNHQTQEGYLKIPANILTGTHMNPDLKRSDFGLEFIFGTSMYGENLFPSERTKITDEQWEALFARDFYLNFLQYYYLNRLKRLKVEGELKNRTAYFSNDVRVSLADSSVYQNTRLLRSGNTLCFPVLWKNDNSIAAYSEKGAELNYTLPESWNQIGKAEVFFITKNGLIKKEDLKINDNKLKISIEAGKPLLIVPEK